MTEAEIVNVVATASLNQTVDLRELNGCKEFIYNSATYNGRVAYFKLNEMQGKVSIFSSGKMISVGTKSAEQSINELELAKETLIKMGLIKQVQLFPKTRNMIVTVDLKREIDLNEIIERTRAIYEPEQFPAAILRLKEPFKTTILIFASGKLVISGLKHVSEIEPVVKSVENIFDH